VGLAHLKYTAPAYIAIPELRIGCGYAGGAERSIDLWAIDANATRAALLPATR
jgi:hypothetical protein